MLKLRGHNCPRSVDTYDPQFFFTEFVPIKKNEKGEWRKYKRHYSNMHMSLIDIMYKKKGKHNALLYISLMMPLRVRNVC